MHWCMYVVEASASTEYAWHLFMSLTLVGKLSIKKPGIFYLVFSLYSWIILLEEKFVNTAWGILKKDGYYKTNASSHPKIWHGKAFLPDGPIQQATG